VKNNPKGVLLTPVTPQLLEMLDLALLDRTPKQLSAFCDVSTPLIYDLRRSRKKVVNEVVLEKLLRAQSKFQKQDFKWFTKKELVDLEILKVSQKHREPIQFIGGIAHKKCNGPLHLGKFIPVTEFYEHKSPATDRGIYRPRCKRCEIRQRGYSGSLVKLSKVHFIFEELVNRIGRAETARRMGISSSNLTKIIGQRHTYVRHKNVTKAMRLLTEIRKTSEVRHRDSIINGSTRRGLPEKAITSRKDYYKPHGDEDSARRRKSRARSR
jgi:hypothetical protein